MAALSSHSFTTWINLWTYVLLFHSLTTPVHFPSIVALLIFSSFFLFFSFFGKYQNYIIKKDFKVYKTASAYEITKLKKKSNKE